MTLGSSLPSAAPLLHTEETLVWNGPWGFDPMSQFGGLLGDTSPACVVDVVVGCLVLSFLLLCVYGRQWVGES